MSACAKCGMAIGTASVGTVCAGCAQIARQAAVAAIRQDLTLRQRYAMAALTGLCANVKSDGDFLDQMAANCFRMADAMLAAEREPRT